MPPRSALPARPARPTSRPAPVLVAALLAAALAVPAVGVRAQPPAGAAERPEGPYARARRLVTEGEGVAGRTVVDSLLAASTPGTAAYAEALYWRATLAERGADAERDYRLLAVEYAFSPRAVDALVRLAQLDLVRGAPTSALERLERMLRDHPDAAVQARGRYWLARAHLDAGDPRAACAALDAAAAAAVPGSDAARQVAGFRPSVPNCETLLARATPSAAAPASAAARPASTPPATTPRPATAPATSPATSPATTPPVATSSATTSSATSRPAPSATAPTPARDAPRYTVQVAAYPQRPGADAAAARLVAAGLPARVSAQGPDGDRPPFRVRVGLYDTRAAATAALRDLRRRKMAGFVTEAEPGAASARP